MSENSIQKKKLTNLEAELYLLIVKFLRTGPCKESAEILREEIEKHELLPKRVDWLGNEHIRSFNELESTLSQISNDHLLKICSCIGPILDKEIPPTVHGLTSLLGVGRQSLLRTKEDLEKPQFQMTNLIARKNSMPLMSSHAAQSQYPPNITQVLVSREMSGPVSRQHTFTPKVYARQQLYRRILGHLSSVYCILFDRTGKYIFTGADDLLVKIWSASDGRLLAALRGHSAEITDMAVNYENTLIAAGSCDKTIRVWSLLTAAPVAVLSGHTGMVTSLQFCPYPKNADRLLISTGNDGCICFWFWNPKTNVFNPKPLKFTERNKPNAQMVCSSFSAGGVFLATGSTDHNIRVYNIAGFNGPEKILEREVNTDRVDSIQFSYGGCRFISGSKDGTALIWKYERPNWTSIQLKMATKLAGQSDEADDNKIKLRVTMVGWTLDDSKVITAVSDFTIKVWNSYNGNLCSILKGHEDEVFVIEPHPIDPRVFLSSGHDGRIIIWDLLTGTIIKNHFNLIEGQGHGAVFDTKFSPDGLTFASTDSHGHLSIFGFGSSDRYKKVPEEQFFHTDYRPLIRDAHGHVLDEQTQTAPHLLPPPFLVDIDGNPYPPHFQRQVPGREHQNEAQLIPYVAVSAQGDSEILEPVRPPVAPEDDRPTIDDMIERLQQERGQNESPRRQESAFSPRTPRSQSGHSRVGLRRTGDVEGVVSVGHWQSRNQGDSGSHQRVVVKPMSPYQALYALDTRQHRADIELLLFKTSKKEDKKESNLKQIEPAQQRRSGNRAGLRSLGALNNTNSNEEEEEGETTARENSAQEESSSESDKQEDSFNSGEESDSGDHSDWAPYDAPRSPRPSTSAGRVKRQIKPRHRLVSSEDEAAEEGESDSPQRNENIHKQTNKKKVVNGKVLQSKVTRLPPEWLIETTPNKTPYFPQIGDEVIYFRQGHELYVQAVHRNRVYDIKTSHQPWHSINLREQEVARVDDISFVNHPPVLCCVTLTLLNPASKDEDSFEVRYHDMPDVIDFIILRQCYDRAIQHDWKPGDRFRSSVEKQWWLGTIKAHKPLQVEYQDSMFQCFLVKWDSGEREHMSPWDFEPVDSNRLPTERGGSVSITAEERTALMYRPSRHEWSSLGREVDCERITRGLSRIMELHIADLFTEPVDLHAYPMYSLVVEYPIDLGSIRERVNNRFYRRLDSLKFDIQFIEINAKKFNEPGTLIVKRAKCLVDLCLKFINLPHCTDPMVLYHEMMEAKQSRSQDSQSELDVLCSETDCDGENRKSARLKRKKKTLDRSQKRLCSETKKYTSTSWRQQCATLVQNFIQCEDSTPFRYPVDLNIYRDYRDIIDIPMDLSTAQEKLNCGAYNSPTDFCKDMRLIFQNSRNYNTNKKSRIYSMTIRLSAMFEEHIRGIVSDWRSAVKYEEKIRNHQYVSQRRNPVLVQEADVNVGASTSHSRLTGGKIHNGIGSKQKLHQKHSSPNKKTAFIIKRKVKPSMNKVSSLTNGIHRSNVMRSAKRKHNDQQQSSRRSERFRRKADDNVFSQSESDSNQQNNSSSQNSSDSVSRQKSKRRRKDQQDTSRHQRPTRSTSNVHTEFHSYSKASRFKSTSGSSSPIYPSNVNSRSKKTNYPEVSPVKSRTRSHRHKRSDNSKVSRYKSPSRSPSPEVHRRSVSSRGRILKPTKESRTHTNSDPDLKPRYSRRTGNRQPKYKETDDDDTMDSDDEEVPIVQQRRFRKSQQDYKESSTGEASQNTEDNNDEPEEEKSKSGDDDDGDNSSDDSATRKSSLNEHCNSNAVETRKSHLTRSRTGHRNYNEQLEDEEEDAQSTIEDDDSSDDSVTRDFPTKQRRCTVMQSQETHSPHLTRSRTGHIRPNQLSRHYAEETSGSEFSESSEEPKKKRKTKKGKHLSRVTRNRGQRTVQYQEDNESDDNNPSRNSRSFTKGDGKFKENLRSSKEEGEFDSKSKDYVFENRRVGRPISTSKSVVIKRPFIRNIQHQNTRRLAMRRIIPDETPDRIIDSNEKWNLRSNMPFLKISRKTRSKTDEQKNSNDETIRTSVHKSRSLTREVFHKSNQKRENVRWRKQLIKKHISIAHSIANKSSNKPTSENKLIGLRKRSLTHLSKVIKFPSKPLTSTNLPQNTSMSSFRKDDFIRHSKNRTHSSTEMKWSLRAQSSKTENSATALGKVQTRYRGKRTVTYDEDIGNNYLTEILENEDPIKQRQKTNVAARDEAPCQRLKDVVLRPKKQALKMLSNGIETRNHGQRTTLYAEDEDDYLEQYFENLGL